MAGKTGKRRGSQTGAENRLSFWYSGGLGVCAVLFVGAGIVIGARFGHDRQSERLPTSALYVADVERRLDAPAARPQAGEPPMLGLPAALRRIEAMTAEAGRPVLAPPPPPQRAAEPETTTAQERPPETGAAVSAQPPASPMAVAPAPAAQLAMVAPSNLSPAAAPSAAARPPIAAEKANKPSKAVAIVPPAVRTDDAAPWRRFAAPVPAGSGPRIAIIIDDLGLSRERSIRAARIPGPLTLSFLPYADGLPAFVEWARQQGATSGGSPHEIMLHLPMEPVDRQHNNPGPNALLTTQDDSEMLRRLRWSLDRFGGIVGVNNHMGSRFTMDAGRMRLVMAELRERGLLWIDSRTIGSSVGEQVAQDSGVPTAGRDVFLDNEHHAAAVGSQLKLTEEVARRKGEAIAIGHPHEGTLAAIEQWLPQAKARGFVIVPVSAIVARRSGSG